jgi:hypothetical protein
MSHLELGELLLEAGDGHSGLILALSVISREDFNRVGSKAATEGRGTLRSRLALDRSPSSIPARSCKGGDF